ncbi:hypothetical protein F4779DRAFT_424984 [Xylariaceae sp. FL0662B]|nr:hypothetical protein F4779DRAFT_424984 [Xylariaceae sp. FL0662B]
MGSWTGFLLTYLFGGITFIPLLIIAVLLHAHYTFPVRDDSTPEDDDDTDPIVQPGDDITELREAQKEESRQRLIAESDVAAGYFAVCREYTPMGINAKPIERSTPVGSTTVAAPSQSVYQSMYKSIFERKQTPGPLDDNKSISQRPKRAGNVFYVVLRHGHLMLFDDDEQIEVRHVISLAHHDVSIYSGGDRTPEGELFIKRNALCLTRGTDGKEWTPDTPVSKPFYLFSENCSAKEDFYFSLLRNQAQSFAAQNLAPKPQQFEVKNIISLVQKLHSSEDHRATRWLNAFIGRMFLGIYKTKDIENFVREKLTKKISRVNRPSFLSRIAIQSIDTGDSAPLITNPRLKDLNVEGDCVMEADLKYTGKFRLEVAATARIDLGSRFKVREVNLILAVVLKKLEGHVYAKIKPPPSNRLWFSFQSMPKMEMTIEPIVSSRQITYTVILRQIENRIKEVVAETLVTPFWDDLPFFNTEHKRWRGGIFEGDDAIERSPDHESIAAQLGHIDEVTQIEETDSASSSEPRPFEKSHNVPAVETNHSAGFWSRKLNPRRTSQFDVSQNSFASTSALDARSPQSSTTEIPRPIRSGSFSASSPIVSTDPTHAETFKPSTPPDRDDAASAMASISARSKSSSPGHTPVGSPSRPSSIAQAGGLSSSSSSEAIPEVRVDESTPTAQGRRHTTSSTESFGNDTASPSSPTPSTKNSINSGTSSAGKGFFSRKETSSSVSTNGTPENKRNTFTAVSNAAATAKRWGLNAIQRQGEKNPNGRKLSEPHVDLNQPMGRGQPLPPPGTPLPGPGGKTMPILVPKRKPVAPPPRPTTRQSSTSVNEIKIERRPVPPPPLPRRRRVSQIHSHEGSEENVLIIEAPTYSEPNTPSDANSPGYVQPWVEDADELDASDELPTPEEAPERHLFAPELPPRRSTSKDREAADGHQEDDDEEGYSNWIDDSEFKMDDVAVKPIHSEPVAD